MARSCLQWNKHARVDPQEEDDLNTEQQGAESRHQKKDLDTKKETQAASILQNLVKLFFIKIVRISGFSSLFQRSQYFSTFCQSAKNSAIAEKREKNPEILTNLMRKMLTGKGHLDTKKVQTHPKFTKSDFRACP